MYIGAVTFLIDWPYFSNYITDGLLHEMFKTVVKNCCVKTIHVKELVTTLARLDRVTAAHPTWIQGVEYKQLLARFVENTLFYNSNDDNVSANNLNIIWHALHAEGTYIKTFATQLCSKDQFPNNTGALICLLGLLTTEYGNSPHYASLWTVVSTSQMRVASIKPPHGNEVRGRVSCTCVNCKSLVQFLRSQQMTMHLKARVSDRHLLSYSAKPFNLKSQTLEHGMPRTLVLTKTAEMIQSQKDAHTKAVNSCRKLLQLKPAGKDAVALEALVGTASLTLPASSTSTTQTSTGVKNEIIELD
ncbi:hypothetical protein SAMD00019534_072110 [Acytostelium subglobosum LB1]|uniref:hypothetical protein n=1 Tax=Acytostelium subglobosum LB1 TaxID=1410327 RepID=UPI0006449EA5|nr:hypothetical protein SAMD00019534_072110 [Acytostelium subglobosum LB1]GAM24036.1 hypothetical protein SAMD00019534_072110 [Acytostelium subglobosum LB1]|eukprot:XP_012753072.1 hypothetical protein SAMD00019534_072110 [Acytostelium subglobosum LB1]